VATEDTADVGKVDTSAAPASKRLARLADLRGALTDAAGERPALAATAALLSLAVVSALLHILLVGFVHGPFVFMDELGYERMAQSFAHGGHFSLFGKAGLAYSPLYPIVLSPIYALASLHAAYEWVKVENSVLISLSVFPVYGIARTVLPRGRSIGVAALSLIAPLMLYSAFEMSESLAYPLCLLAVWTMLRAVRRPGVVNDAILLASILLATAARIQLVVLVPAALTAVLLVALLRPQPAPSRGAAVLRALRSHWLLFGTTGAALVVGLARRAANGGNLPLAGRYANVGSAQASPLRVFELFFQHLAGLDWAVGVIPFAAALLGGYALVHFGFPRRAVIFASVAVASTFWLLLEVAFDAAAFDATSSRPGILNQPRIHERYLIYLVPLFLVVLVATLPLLLRRKIPTSRLVAIAIVAVALPALIPFGTVINETTSIDSFSLLPFATGRSGRSVPITHATGAILALSALLALVYLLIPSRRVPAPAAVLITVVAFLGVSTLELGDQLTLVKPSSRGLPAHANWVDRAVGSSRDVSLVGSDRVHRAALHQTAFWNESVTRLYYLCRSSFGTDFGERQLMAGSAIRTRYAVVPASLPVSGSVLARDSVGHLVLIAPSGGKLRIPGGLRCRA
jgi:hypothetical protein